MRSRTSSHETVMHTLKTTWQGYGKGMILLAIAFFIAVAGTGFWRCLPFFLSSEVTRYAYILMDGLVAFVLPVLLPVIGAAVALSLFSFLFSKRKAMHVTLFGGDRILLFCVRFLFGALSLTAMLFLSLLASYLISSFAFGFTAIAARNYVYTFLALTETFLLPYTLTALFAMLSGRLSEACVSSLIALLLPEGLTLLVRNFASNFLFGALTNGEFFAETAFTTQSSVSFVKPFGYTDLLPRFYVCYNKNITAEEIAANYPVFYAKIIQYAVIIALFSVAAGLLFKNQPMEHIEKRNVRPYVSYTVAGLSAAVLASFLAWIPNRVVAVIAVIFAFLVLFFFFLSFYKKGFSGFQASCKVALPASGALLIIMTTFLCGFFGFSSRTLHWSEIESVSIEYVGMSYHPTEYSIGGYGASYTVYPRVQGKLIEITNPNNAWKVTEIHNAIIADGYCAKTNTVPENASDTVVGANITIRYTLKDGSKLIRTYPNLKLSTLALLPELDEKADYQAAILALYTPSDELPEGTDGGIEIRSENHFYISGNTGDNLVKVTLNDTDMRTLLAAIRNDKKNEKAAKRYFPEEDCLGILYFPDPGYTSILHDETMTRAYIYAGDVNTINFLREKEMYDVFTRGYTVKECTVYEMPLVMNEDRFDPVYSRVFQLTDIIVVPTEMTENPIALSDAELSRVLDNARAVYFVKDHGYLLQLRITDADGNWLTVYKFSPKE